MPFYFALAKINACADLVSSLKKQKCCLEFISRAANLFLIGIRILQFGSNVDPSFVI